MLSKLRWEAARLWRNWLARRNRDRPPNWQQFNGMLDEVMMFERALSADEVQALFKSQGKAPEPAPTLAPSPEPPPIVAREPVQMQAVRARYERSVEAAKKAYATELDGVQRQLTQQGNLEAALQVRTALDRLSGAPRTAVPAVPAPAQEPAQMQASRSRYERAVDIAKTTFAGELGALQRQFTQAGNLEAALQVKAAITPLSTPAPAAAPAAAPATSASVVFGGHRYEFIPTPLGRSKAEADCRRRGGRLACADSMEELEFLLNLMQQKLRCDFWVDSKVGSPGTLWMGIGGVLHAANANGDRADDDKPYICEWGAEK